MMQVSEYTARQKLAASIKLENGLEEQLVVTVSAKSVNAGVAQRVQEVMGEIAEAVAGVQRRYQALYDHSHGLFTVEGEVVEAEVQDILDETDDALRKARALLGGSPPALGNGE